MAATTNQLHSDSPQAVPRSTKNLQRQAHVLLTKLSKKIEASLDRNWLAGLVQVLKAQLEEASPDQYESQTREAFRAAREEVTKQLETSLSTVNYAMQLNVKQAEKLASAVQEAAPPDELLTASKCTELQKRTWQDQQRRNQLRDALTQGCEQALQSLQRLKSCKDMPHEKLDEERQTVLVSFDRSLAVHQCLATEAASFRSSLELDLSAKDSEVADETTNYMQPLVNNLSQNLNAMEAFLDATVQTNEKEVKANRQHHEDRLTSLRAKEEKYSFADICPGDDPDYKRVLQDITATNEILQKLPKKGELQIKLLGDLRTLRSDLYSDLGMHEEAEEPPKKKRKTLPEAFASWFKRDS